MKKIGDIILHTLTAYDIEQLKYKQRQHQSYVGELVPVIVCRVWPNEFGAEAGYNGQLFVDGDAHLWVTSIKDETPEAMR